MELKKGDKIYQKTSKTRWEITSVSYSYDKIYVTMVSLTSGQIREVTNLDGYAKLDANAYQFSNADIGKAFIKAYSTHNEILSTMQSIEDLINWYRFEHCKKTTLAYTPEQLYIAVKGCHKLKKYSKQDIADHCYIHRRTLEKYCVDLNYKDVAQLIFEKQFIRNR